MTGGNNVNTTFYASVKLNMRWREASRIRPFHRGLDVNIYEPIVDGKNLLRIKGYDPRQITSVDVTITARTINPQPLHERDMHDIDEELALWDSKYGRILKDHLRHTDNKNLIHEQQDRDTLQKHTIVLDHPYLDGQNDHLRSKAQNIHDQTIPMESVLQIQKKFEKRYAWFKRNKLKDYRIAYNRESREEEAVMAVGDI